MSAGSDAFIRRLCGSGGGGDRFGPERAPADTASVTGSEALAWAVANKVPLAATHRLTGINTARINLRLPPFSIIKAQTAKPPTPARSVPMPQPVANPHAIQRTSSGLRDVLFAEMEALRAGKADPLRAVALAKLANVIVNSVRMEIDFMNSQPDRGSPGGMPEPLLLVRT